MNFKKFKNYKFSILIFLVIVVISLVNFQNIPIDEKLLFENFDKVVHLVMYFTLTFSFCIENFKANNYQINKSHLFIVILTSALTGIGLELAQSTLTTYRSGDFYDEFANVSGVVLAFIVFTLIKSNLKKWIQVLKLDKI